MNIIERARAFVQHLLSLSQADRWYWQRCPHCGSTDTCRWGHYRRYPWGLQGRQTLVVQRHRCRVCGRTYSEEKAEVGRGSWYGREVQRLAIDMWQHGGMSLRRVGEYVRSLVGRQERWWQWHPWQRREQDELCHLSHTSVWRWLDKAGKRTQAGIEGQMAGLGGSGLLGADGLWARLRGGGKRVVLLLAESVSGLLWPPLVVEKEEEEASWQKLFARAREAGMALADIRALTSDGVAGLACYLRRHLGWVYQQRCVWHLWRRLEEEVREAAGEIGEQGQEELRQLLSGVVNASSFEQAEEELARMREQPGAEKAWQYLNHHFDEVLVHLLPEHRGLKRVGPEWCWRDFRLRLSRGRNHGSEERLERAALVWAIYRNFNPAQERKERRRHYCFPGRSPLAVAGASTAGISYLDALGV